MKDATKGFAAAIVGIAVLIVAGLVFATMWVFSYGLFVDHTADRSGRTQVKQQINGNGSYRIAAYDHFYDLCSTVQTDKQSLTNITAQIKTAIDPQIKATLNADVLAGQNKLAADVNQYNADARKAATAGQFRASDLPATLDLTGDTTCHA